MNQYVIAIDLGGTTSKMALIHLDGTIEDKWSIATDITMNGINIIPNIIDSIQQKLTEHSIDVSELIAIGMGSPGSVDYINGTVIGAYNLNWRTQQDIRAEFSKVFSCPFVIDNDANVAALGEQWLGAGNNDDHVVMITIGTGVGGGIVIDGSLYHGAMGTAGEIGHLVIEPNSEFECTCGKKGCLEALASAQGIVNVALHLLKEYQGDTTLQTILKEQDTLTAKDILDQAKCGDALSQEIVERLAFYLGIACSHLANILNPSRIVIGGGLSGAGEFLRELIEITTIDYTFPPIRERTQIVLASLGNDAGIIGAARLALNYDCEGK